MKNAEVLVKFVGNTEDLQKKTTEASQIIKGFGKSVGGILKSAGTLALATSGLIVASTLRGIKDIVQSSVEAYSQFEQLEGGLISLFGNGSQEMQQIIEDSENAYQNLTMSQNEYLTAFQSSYPLVNAGLGENKDAIEYTNKALQLSSDLFNTYGGSIEYYQSAINWALKGSFVYLDNLNLGIKGTQEGFIKAANESGILGRNIENVNELTNDEIIDVIQHYAVAYGVWNKTADEASTTILGSLNMVKATWKNFVAGLSKDGDDIDGLIEKVIQSALKFADNIMPVIMRAIDSVAKALPTIAQRIGEELPKLVNTLLPSLVDTLIALTQSLIANLPSIIKTLIDAVIKITLEATKLLPDIIELVIDGANTIVEAVGDAMPELLPTLINAIIKGIVKITEKTPEIIKASITLLMGIVKAIPYIIASLIEALPDIIIAIVDSLILGIPELIIGAIELLMAIIDAIPTIIQELIKALPQIITKIKDTLTSGESLNKLKDAGKRLFDTIVNGLLSTWDKIWDIGSQLVQGLWNGIGDKVNWIIGKIQGFGKSVMKAIKNIFGVHSPSTEFEWVGKMNMLGFEQGMDSMKKQVQDTIDSVFNLQPNVSGNMSSTYSPQMNVIVQNNMELDPLGQVVNQIKTFSGGAKNDYNWGATI